MSKQTDVNKKQREKYAKDEDYRKQRIEASKKHYQANKKGEYRSYTLEPFSALTLKVNFQKKREELKKKQKVKVADIVYSISDLSHILQRDRLTVNRWDKTIFPVRYTKAPTGHLGYTNNQVKAIVDFIGKNYNGFNYLRLTNSDKAFMRSIK